METLPQELEFDQAKDPESDLYCNLNNQPSNSDIPFSIKRAAINLHNFLERCKEEQAHLLLEVKRLFSYYFEEKETLESYVEESTTDYSKLARGIKVVIKTKLCEINNTLYWLGSILLHYLSEQTVSRLPSSEVGAMHMGFSEFSSVEFPEILCDSETDEEELVLQLSDDSDDENVM